MRRGTQDKHERQDTGSGRIEKNSRAGTLKIGAVCCIHAVRWAASVSLKRSALFFLQTFRRGFGPPRGGSGREACGLDTVHVESVPKGFRKTCMRGFRRALGLHIPVRVKYRAGQRPSDVRVHCSSIEQIDGTNRCLESSGRARYGCHLADATVVMRC